MPKSKLCNIAVILLVAVASLDAADKQLLSASFLILEHNFHFNVRTLGYFSLFSNLSYALSLPFWGYLVHREGLKRIYLILASSCCCWGISTIFIAIFGSSVFGQALMRMINGWMLGSILPLSQTLMVEFVPNSMRGRAFGIMTMFEKLSATLAASFSVYCEDHWTVPYWILGCLSLVFGYMVQFFLNPEVCNYSFKNDLIEKSSKITLKQIVQRIARLPAFRCLVAQGIFGGTPWDMMSFQLLLLEWRGFTKSQIVTLQFVSGIAGTLGGWVGGVLGDYFFSVYSTKGRIGIALLSILGGIPLYGIFLYSTSYSIALTFLSCFHFVATWSPAAAIRPICVELTHNPSERAQIVAMWIVLEKASAAIFGAPLVGLLTNRALKSIESSSVLSDEEKSNVMANNLFLLSSLFWGICAWFWVLMIARLPQKNDNVIDQKNQRLSGETLT